jgi:hypothetical protein
MDRPIGRVLVGDDRTLAAKTLLIAVALGGIAAVAAVAPRYWVDIGATGSVVIRLIAGGIVPLSAGCAALVFAAAGDLPPRPPALGVALVIVSLWLVGWGLDVSLLFFVGPILSLGVLAALSSYANNGALAALSLVFVPVVAYLLVTPAAFPPELAGGLRLRLSILLGLLFAFGVGSGGFLVGSWLRWAEEYAELRRELPLDPFDRIN